MDIQTYNAITAPYTDELIRVWSYDVYLYCRLLADSYAVAEIITIARAAGYSCRKQYIGEKSDPTREVNILINTQRKLP